jgi:hypothetical protein
MTRQRAVRIIAVLLVITLGGIAAAQFIGGNGRRRGGGFRGGGAMDMSEPLTGANRRGVEDWEVDPHFKSDVFTFVRVEYSAYGRSYSWQTDYPDSDLNFSFRLQQLTSLKVRPDPIHMPLTDERLFDYPFIYMLEIGSMDLSDDEVTALRRYLSNGGFLMVDDFWGDYQYETLHENLKRVFPEYDPVELSLDHPIFHCVYDLKELPQVPGIEWARRNRIGPGQFASISENNVGPAHYRGLFDNSGRMMVIICQNTDLGDGWEREGEEEWYFHEFSEKKAYPMGINIIFYAMTH